MLAVPGSPNATFRLIGTDLRVYGPTAEIISYLDPFLEPVETEPRATLVVWPECWSHEVEQRLRTIASPFVPVCFSERPGPNASCQCFFIDEQVALLVCPPSLLPLKAIRAVRALAAVGALNRGWVPLHAACLVADGMSLMLVGAKGSGKTTLLTRCLMTREHAEFVSNDVVLVDASSPAEVRLWGVPRAVSLRPASIQLVWGEPGAIEGSGAWRTHVWDDHAEPRLSVPPREFARLTNSRIAVSCAAQRIFALTDPDEPHPADPRAARGLLARCVLSGIFTEDTYWQHLVRPRHDATSEILDRLAGSVRMRYGPARRSTPAFVLESFS